MYKSIFILIVILTACTPVQSVEEQIDPSDKKVYQLDSVNYFNYIKERDSLSNLEQISSADSNRIEILSKEINYLSDKWGKFLK